MTDPGPETESAKGARLNRYLLWFAGALLLLLAANLGLAWSAFGLPNKRAVGSCAGIDRRVEAAAMIDAPKLVLIGGSGVARGVDGGALAEAIGLPVVNFGLQAGLGPEIILGEARAALKPGDSALLLFEYNAFDYGAPSSVALEFVAGCRQSYFEQASLQDKLIYLLGMTPGLILESYRSDSKAPAEAAAPGPPVTLQCQAGLASFGDETEFAPITERDRRRLSLYRPIRFKVDPDSAGARAIARFADWARAHDVTALASWPNTIDFPQYRDDPAFGQVEGFYAGLGLPVIGEPSLALLPWELFDDTQYHLQPEGIRRRTTALAALLKPRFAETAKAIRRAGPTCRQEG